MIAAAQFCFSFAAAGAAAHLIAYLIGVGYAATRAALVMALIFGLTSLGKLAVGILADRVGGRVALVLSFLVAAGGFLLVLGAAHVAVLVCCVLLLGITFGAPLVLVPMVIAQSLGLRRFGSIAGLTGLLGTLGAAFGPPVAGRIFDVTGSYVHAFLLFFGMVVVGALAATGCRPLAREQALAPQVGEAA
jgi:MFS family permease